MHKHATARTHTLVRRGDDVDEAAPSVSDSYGSRAIIPVVRGRPRFPLLALQFAMDEGEEDNSTSNYDDEDSTAAATGREWEEEQEEGNTGGSVRRCDYRVTCRALVLHPTVKSNRDVYLQKSHALRRPRPTMETMPQDTLKLIFRFLPAPSLLASEIVCRLWRDLASKDDAHWEELCKRTYGISPENFSPPPDPVKLLYMLTYSSLSEIKYGSSGGGSGRMGGSLRFLF